MSSTPRLHPLRRVPAFLVGAAAATAAEVAMALLLYGGPGLMRSLTTVLVVESAALGLGLLGVPRDQDDPVEALRKRWLFCMVVFLGATLFSASWSLFQDLGGGAMGQGLGLAAMGALPLYACGAVLSGMAETERRWGETGAGGQGGPAALGAAVGFLATGFALPRLLTPASLFLTCLVLLSAGGLVYGATLDGREEDEDEGEAVGRPADGAGGPGTPGRLGEAWAQEGEAALDARFGGAEPAPHRKAPPGEGAHPGEDAADPGAAHPVEDGAQEVEHAPHEVEDAATRDSSNPTRR